MAGVSSQQKARQTFFYDYGRRPHRGPDALAGGAPPTKHLQNAINKQLPQKSVTKERSVLQERRPNVSMKATDKNAGAFDAIKKRLKAAAYNNGKLDWDKLFRYYDKDNSGCIDWDEFRAAIRKSAKITTAQLSDRDLRLLFEFVDVDGDGEVDYKQEFMPWLATEDKGSSHTASAQDLDITMKKPEIVKKQPSRMESRLNVGGVGGIEQQQALAAQELFARMDVNKTGTLTFRDFERGLQRRSLATPFAQALGKKEAWSSPDARKSAAPKAVRQVVDPLNLQAPPMSVDTGVDDDDYEMLLADGDYEAAGLNPDSAVADVESLLAQEKLLEEQAKWWEARDKSERAARKAFQAELRAQDSQFGQEVRDLEAEIRSLRNEQAEMEERSYQHECEAKDFRNEAAVAAQEIEMIKPKLAELRQNFFMDPKSVPGLDARVSLENGVPRNNLAAAEKAGLTKSESTNSVKSAILETNAANPIASPKASERSAGAPAMDNGDARASGLAPPQDDDFDLFGGDRGGAPAPQVGTDGAANVGLSPGFDGTGSMEDFMGLIGGDPPGAPAPPAAPKAANADGDDFGAFGDLDAMGSMDFMALK